MAEYNDKKFKKAKGFVIELLEIIKDIAEALPKPLESKYAYQRRLKSSLRGYSPNRIDRGLYYLKQKGLIKKKKAKDAAVYELTVSGKQKLLLTKAAQSKWKSKTGESCIIIFDIPEDKRKHRRFIRRYLINNGFTNLQKSVLIGPRFLPKEFFDVLEDWKLRQNVTLIKGRILYL